MNCPKCQNGKFVAFVTRLRRPEDGPPEEDAYEPELVSGIAEVPCEVCRGTGIIDDATVQRLEEGERLREDRVRRGVSLRAEAAALRLDVVELSKKERGVT